MARGGAAQGSAGDDGAPTAARPSSGSLLGLNGPTVVAGLFLIYFFSFFS